jgi:hypothetical protein
MLSWKLWRGLRRAFPEHPLYTRVLGTAFKPMGLAMACAIILVAPFLLLPGLLFMSAIYALRWAVQIASIIAREREASTYDLVALTPFGPLGCNRAISAACLHRHESLEQIQSPGAWIMRMVFSLILVVSFAGFTEPILSDLYDPGLNTFIALFYLATMALAIMIDHVQSIVAGNLIGMLTPHYVRGRVDAGLVAFAGFVGVQLVTYVFTLLAGFRVLPDVLLAVNAAPLFITLSLPLIRLALFCTVREFLIQVLWRALISELNVTTAELDFMTRPSA